MTMCCQRVSFQEPMYYDETNCRFGTYDRCPKCMRLTGREANIAYTAPHGIRTAWTALSEVYTREYFKPGEGRPMRYAMSKAGLVPCGFVLPVADGEAP